MFCVFWSLFFNGILQSHNTLKCYWFVSIWYQEKEAILKKQSMIGFGFLKMSDAIDINITIRCQI